ncbi:hypothetical protein Q4555_06690 [Octadecabacter sp. 1_MG-2023]|uniref:hypothetical protein n=1 Tax=unclassified Octadecabacter TaxID=196158 RepID=UPI001C08002D|nr:MULTISPECIES: hypothetical protein [unclassified Octadecabacter]MBU2994363.1 hypothetical protein [Octadecabacter sp. B2R22]MDO6734348.1 hypothetical protein [Octadecabacter sp. 1_MG-2023]
MKGLFGIVFAPIASLIPWRKIIPHTVIGNPHRDTRAMNQTQHPNRAHSNRVHVFHGTFESELDATRYCIDAPSRNEPEPLTRDLPDATIDTSEVEIVFGGPRIGAAVPMITLHPDGLFQQIGSNNTVILLSEAAFCGLPYTLNDTPKLRYAGAFDVT